MPRTAEDGRGDGVHDPAQHRQQAEDHEDPASRGDDEAALDAGQRHHADVLGEGADREAVEDRGDGRGAHVGPQARCDPLPVDVRSDDLPDGPCCRP
jgi:hypothetical protein